MSKSECRFLYCSCPSHRLLLWRVSRDSEINFVFYLNVFQILLSFPPGPESEGKDTETTPVPYESLIGGEVRGFIGHRGHYRCLLRQKNKQTNFSFDLKVLVVGSQTKRDSVSFDTPESL